MIYCAGILRKNFEEIVDPYKKIFHYRMSW